MNAKKKHSTKIIGIILLFLGICVISFTAYHFFKNDAKSKTPNSKTSEEIPQTEKPSGNNPDELLNYSSYYIVVVFRDPLQGLYNH